MARIFHFRTRKALSARAREHTPGALCILYHTNVYTIEKDLSFETAIEVFSDPFIITQEDIDNEGETEPVGHRQNQIAGLARGRLRRPQPARHRDHPFHFRKKGREV